MWLSFGERGPIHQKFAGSFPGQARYLDCRFSPQLEGNRLMLLSHVNVSLSLPLFLCL